MTNVLPVGEAVRRLGVDQRLLAEELAGRSERELTGGFRVNGGPLGDFCESLRDLVAHVLMWDEINLAVLTEMRLGREHWSLGAEWETRQAGQLLNRAGVAAGRELPVGLLVERSAVVSRALVAELDGYRPEEWHAPTGLAHPSAVSVGALAQHVMTVPGMAPYWHAAIHLGRLAEVGGASE